VRGAEACAPRARLCPSFLSAQGFEQTNRGKGKTNNAADQQNRILHHDRDDISRPTSEFNKDGADVSQISGQGSSSFLKNSFFRSKFISQLPLSISADQGLDDLAEKQHDYHSYQIDHRLTDQEIQNSLQEEQRKLLHSDHERIKPPNSLKQPAINIPNKTAPVIQA